MTGEPTSSCELAGLVPLRGSEAGQSPSFFPELHTSAPRTDPEIGFGPIKLERRGTTSHAKQARLALDLDALRETVIAKLVQCGHSDLIEPLCECHTKQVIAKCESCATVKKYWNRCEVFYCPSCQPRLAKDRRNSIEWWSNHLKQPKHVVLTVRNTDQLDRDYVDWFKACFRKLRRTKFARNWSAGCFSLEVTNEGKGWHLHLHALIEAKYIPADQLAQEWARLVGQEFAIVCVKDVRNKAYLQEVTKYAVSGNELAGWTGHQIATYIRAFKGGRMFGVFGELHGLRSSHKEWVDAETADKHTCECGCSRFRLFTPAEWEWYEAVGDRPPPTFGQKVMQPLPTEFQLAFFPPNSRSQQYRAPR